MFHRFTAQLMLAYYGAIALCGQGLHLWTHDDACCATGQCEVATTEKHATCSHSPKCGHSHRHVAKPQADGGSKLRRAVDVRQPSIQSQSPLHGHDCESCVICQHQSLGQIFAMSPPAVRGPVVSDVLCTLSAESALCPALHSSAQPRAPPAV